ncbi:hypothetical protein RBA10_22430, partial [Mycobacteroides abscessus subsp. abscessus]|uniref:hypothetical protein n=1 Tax=Mycobacteroides abscessus TaxID=36809 RepID=UPI003CFADA65
MCELTGKPVCAKVQLPVRGMRGAADHGDGVRTYPGLRLDMSMNRVVPGCAEASWMLEACKLAELGPRQQRQLRQRHVRAVHCLKEKSLEITGE